MESMRRAFGATIYDLPLEILDMISNYLSMTDRMSLRLTCWGFYMGIRDGVEEKLYSNQVDHYRDLILCLKENKCAYDTSIMGSGKTYTACAVAAKLRLSLTVFCPKSVCPVWERVASYFRIDEVMVNTYASLRLNLNRTYLNLVEKEGRTKYVITPEWFNKIRKGTLLVFDEAHALKNDTVQVDCARVLAKGIFSRPDFRSYVLYISATPFDKKEQVGRICQLLNVIRKSRLAHQDIYRGYVLVGIQDLIDYCEWVSDLDLSSVARKIDKFNKYNIMMELFTNHVKSRFFLSMPPPILDKNAKLDAKNGYYKLMSRDAKILMDEVIQELREIVQNETQIEWNRVLNSCRKSEKAKLEIFIRKTRSILNSDNWTKVIIMFNYLEPIELCTRFLSSYNPLVITGKTPLSTRDEYITKFNTDAQCRLLIGSMSVTCLGVSLHDTTGKHPRVMFLSPTYSVINMHQASLRIHRIGSKSPATLRFVYARDHIDETRLIEIIAKKSEHLKSLRDEKLKDVKYPGEYEAEIEN